MTAEALPATRGDPGELRCHDCDEVVAARVRHTFGPEVYLAAGVHPYRSDLVVTKARNQWLVRDLVPGEVVPKENLRRRHECMPHPFKCQAARSQHDGTACGGPARLFAGGKFCERHRP
jgi:hypothetical protein